MWQMLLVVSHLFSRWENWGSEKSYNLPSVLQPVRDEARIWTQDIKDWEGSGVLLYLQPNKWACYNFRDAGCDAGVFRDACYNFRNATVMILLGQRQRFIAYRIAVARASTFSHTSPLNFVPTKQREECQLTLLHVVSRVAGKES